MKHPTNLLLSVLFTLVVLIASAPAIAEGPGGKIRFQKTQLDARFRSEGVAVGDFNKDGKMDIAAGSVWYSAPDWKMHAILAEAKEFQPKGYSNSFCNFADDLNGDGWTDLIVVDEPGKATRWYENPRGAAGPWKEHLVTPVTNNESPQYLDVDGNGKRVLVLGFSPHVKQPDSPLRRLGFARPVKDLAKPWLIQAISAAGAPGSRKYSHGLGVGDLNDDGLVDVLVPKGWWEAPSGTTQTSWRFRPTDFGLKAAQMVVYDFDGDGDADVLSSSAHNYGIWWHEQLPDGKWKTHDIDRSFSQSHGLCLADINGDGLPDFVTGKRWWAHGGRDPGGKEPAVFCWFELTRTAGKPTWIRHQFDHDSGPGTQFEVADVNGDNLPDIVTSNKKGVHYFQQVRD